MNLRAALVIAIAASNGCLRSSLVPCGEQLCPAGDQCVEDRCASPAEIEACAHVPDGGSCSVAGAVGVCDRGVCIAAGCGNGIEDPGEQCDDGNHSSGDGCRSDCRKVEICGDGQVDEGEPCDDGNSNAADGCDACAVQVWRAHVVVGGDLRASSEGIETPYGIALDLAGHLYIVEGGGNRVRRVDKSGVITNVAGTGVAGYGGDGGAATSAMLRQPNHVAVDALGNVYIADTGNHRIRRVDPRGVITTIAGTGVPGFSGDSNVAINATLSSPRGIAVSGLGELYIGDSGNGRVRQIDAFGVIRTVAGGGTVLGDGGPATSAQLGSPVGLALDASGNLYIADELAHRVRRVDPSGTISTYAGNGTISGVRNPTGVALDTAGALVVAEAHRVLLVTAPGVFTSVAGAVSPCSYQGDGGPTLMARFCTPRAVAVDADGAILVSDEGNHRVRRIAAGMIDALAGTGAAGYNGDGGTATSARLRAPAHVAFDSAGNLYIADAHADRFYFQTFTFTGRIRRVDTSGVITTVAGSGSVYPADGPATTVELRNPTGLAFDASGQLLISDTSADRVRQVDASGTIATIAGGADPSVLFLPRALAVDGADIYIAAEGNHRVKRYDPTAPDNLVDVAGNGSTAYNGDGIAATAATLNRPTGVAAKQGILYIADRLHHRIRQVVGGVITTFAGTGVNGYNSDDIAATAAQLDEPASVALGANGDLFIADTGNLRVRRVSATAGTITTVAGTGVAGNLGDGGPATSAELAARGPFDPHASIALDPAGDLYIADTSNNRIRKVDATGTITTVAGAVDPPGMGPLARARLADPRALVVTPTLRLIAGGSSGTVQATRDGRLETVIGRYPSSAPTADLARYRSSSFGAVGGVAYDAAARRIYLTETSSERIHVVSMIDSANETTWTIATLANTAGTSGFADGPAAGAQFRGPTALYLDTTAQQLYVADTGNHVVRAIDLSAGIGGATVRTVAGTPATRGLFGDGGAAGAALLHAPEGITRCRNGDLFIADTGNQRVRRVDAATGTITTVLGDGVQASSGEGAPARAFPVDAPLGLGCDAIGNLFTTSTTAIRVLPADPAGIVDGTGLVLTIYGRAPRDQFPESVTRCLTGLAVIDAHTLQVADACSGLLVELRREQAPP